MSVDTVREHQQPKVLSVVIIDSLTVELEIQKVKESKAWRIGVYNEKAMPPTTSILIARGW